MDWRPSAARHHHFQGDYYNGYSGEDAVFPTFMPPDYSILEPNVAHVSGDNLLLNWQRVLGDRSDWTALDLLRPDPAALARRRLRGETRTPATSISSIAFPWESGNEVICGLGYRNVRDSTQATVPMSWSRRRSPRISTVALSRTSSP